MDLHGSRRYRLGADDDRVRCRRDEQDSGGLPAHPLRRRRRDTHSGRHPRRGAAAAARHGHRRQHRDVGAVRAGARRLRHPDDRLRRARCRGVDGLASPAPHGRPRVHRRPPRRRARLPGGRRARRLLRRCARATAGAPVPGSRPQARARRHGAGSPGTRGSPRPAERHAGAGDAVPVLLARVLPQGRADALRRADQARARAVGESRPTRDWSALRRCKGMPRSSMR